MSLSGRIGPVISLKDERAGDWEQAESKIESPSDWIWTVVDGVSAGQANKMWGDRITGITTSPTVLSVEALVGGIYGNVSLGGRVKAIIIRADPANAADLHLLQPATTGVPIGVAPGDGIKIQPGGLLILVAPNTGYVTGANNDLNLVAASGTLAADVILVGGDA